MLSVEEIKKQREENAKTIKELKAKNTPENRREKKRGRRLPKKCAPRAAVRFFSHTRLLAAGLPAALFTIAEAKK